MTSPTLLSLLPLSLSSCLTPTRSRYRTRILLIEGNRISNHVFLLPLLRAPRLTSKSSKYSSRILLIEGGPIFNPVSAVSDSAISVSCGKLTRRSLDGSNEARPQNPYKQYVIREEDCTGVPTAADRKDDHALSYTSFGHEGTTASLGVKSNLAQITRYLGLGKSGFISLDVEEVDEPYLVEERAIAMADVYSDPDAYMISLYCWPHAPDSYDGALEGPFKLDFVHDRWPRFVEQLSRGVTATDLYYIRDGIVFQRVIYQTKGDPVDILTKKTNLRFIPS